MARTRTGLVAALDVGSAKICCLIAHALNDGAVRVIGVGHHAASGVRGGAIVDMDAAEAAILKAVTAAEELAGERIRAVTLNVSGGKLESRTRGVETAIAGRAITDADIRRLIAQAGAVELPADRELLHCLPVGYTVDSTRGIRDPRGMFADSLAVNVHLVTARAATLRNLATCVERCHLDIESTVASPYASGLACLVADEIDLGVTLVDMGAGTTTIAVFYDGEAIHVESIPIGGQHVTNDIARGLSTSIAHAERMKTLYGSATPSPSDERELIDVPLIGEDAPHQPNHVPRSLLNGIIRPRIEETLELVRSHLEIGGVGRISGRRMVLTGGASQLQGVRELAALIVEKQVRMGRPMRISGLAESTSGPAFSTCAGLLRFAVDKQVEALETAEHMPAGVPWRLNRLGQWFKENF